MGSSTDTAPLWRPPVLLLAATAVWVCGCEVDQLPSFQRTVEQPPAPVAPLSVNVIEIIRDDDAYKTLFILGNLKATRETQLRFGRSGSVNEVYKQIGDRLKVDDPLAELDNDQLNSQKATAEQTLARLNNELKAPRSTPASTLRQQIKQVESQLKTLDTQIDSGRIQAPYPCVVVQRNVDIGSVVSPATPAFQVIEDGPPLIESTLARSIATLVETGQNVFVKLDNAYVQAKLIAKSPQLDPTASQRVLFEFSGDLPSSVWAYGKVVEIRARVRTKEFGFWLPLSSLQREASGLWSALVVMGDEESERSEFEIERRMLEVVQLEDDWALVQGALRSQDQVVVNGTHRIVPGQRVNPVNVSVDFKPPFSAESAP